MRDLKIFSAEKHKERRLDEPAVRINIPIGTFTFNMTATEILDLQAGDMVNLGFDERMNDWFVYKVKEGGFVLRVIGKERGRGLIFNNATTAQAVAKSIKFRGKSFLVRIGSEPEVEAETKTHYWSLITAAVENE